MKRKTLLQTIAELTHDSHANVASRAEILDATGLSDDELGAQLDELDGLGIISGVKVDEVRGPIKAIELTLLGRRNVDPPPEVPEDYLGYSIVSNPVVSHGSSTGEHFRVTQDGSIVVELIYTVTHTAAGELGEPADKAAYDRGGTYLRGLLSLDEFDAGQVITKVIDSSSIREPVDRVQDDELETRVLRAAKKAQESEPRSTQRPYLDVIGIANVLETSELRVAQAILRLESLGQLESNATKYGRSIDQGACRITGDGLQRLREVTSGEGRALSALQTVVFTDIVNSTEFVSRVGDTEAREAMRGIEQQVEELAGEHGGKVIKNLGDGSLLSFRSNSEALAFALNLQDNLQGGLLELRVGMAAGEPIQEAGDIHGAVVTQASRVADLGQGGEVIVADSVRQLAMGKDFNFAERGGVHLKGLDGTTVVWAVTANPRS